MPTKPDVDLQLFISPSAELDAQRFEDLPSLPFVHAAIVRETSEPPASQGETPARIHDGRPKYTVVANSEVVETVYLPFAGEEIRTTIEKLDRDTLRMHACVDFGIRLFDFIFSRRIRDLYRELSLQAEREDRKLRVTIATSAPELAVLPWEIMCDTYPRLLPTFLCHSSRLHLVRALRLFNRASFEETVLGDEDEVRILVVTASPEGDSPIDVDMDGRLLQYLVAQEPRIKGVRLEQCNDATVASLRERLHEVKPHVVHLACHAGYNPKEDLGFVVLVSAKDNISSDRIHSFRLATLLQECSDLQLVFINSCFGAHQRALSSFSGIAQCLHAVGIPNVVALQFSLLDTTAHAIVMNFYDHLLRASRSAEDSVSELRRLMFIDGHMTRETFGISLFQTNTTVCRPPIGTPATERKPREFSFLQMFEQYEKNLEGRIEAELEIEPTIYGWEVDQPFFYYEDLSPSYLTKMHEALGFWSLALLLPERLGKVLGIHEELANKPELQRLLLPMLERTADLARRLSATPFENDAFQTALAVMTEEGLQEYRKRHELAENKTSKMRDIFQISLRAVTKIAYKVNGRHRALAVVVNPQKREYQAIVQTLADVKPGGDASFPQATARWAALQNLLHVSGGWAFILPGGGRVKFLVRGEQLVEYVSADWVSSCLPGLRHKVVQLAAELQLAEEVLIDVFEKCLYASDKVKPVGKAIIIQRSDDVLAKGAAKGFDPNLDSFQDLKESPITEISPDNFLRAAAGDRAVLISREGYTLAVNMPIATSTEVVEVDGAGERHRSAQELTGRTDAVAVVVSENRPITVFVKGQQRLTFPVPKDRKATKSQ